MYRGYLLLKTSWSLGCSDLNDIRDVKSILQLCRAVAQKRCQKARGKPALRPEHSIMPVEVHLYAFQKRRCICVENHFLHIELVFPQHAGKGTNGIAERMYGQRQVMPIAAEYSSIETISVGNTDHQLPVVSQNSIRFVENLI